MTYFVGLIVAEVEDRRVSLSIMFAAADSDFGLNSAPKNTLGARRRLVPAAYSIAFSIETLLPAAKDTVLRRKLGLAARSIWL